MRNKTSHKPSPSLSSKKTFKQELVNTLIISFNSIMVEYYSFFIVQNAGPIGHVPYKLWWCHSMIKVCADKSTFEHQPINTTHYITKHFSDACWCFDIKIKWRYHLLSTLFGLSCLYQIIICWTSLQAWTPDWHEHRALQHDNCKCFNPFLVVHHFNHELLTSMNKVIQCDLITVWNNDVRAHVRKQSPDDISVNLAYVSSERLVWHLIVLVLFTKLDWTKKSPEMTKSSTHSRLVLMTSYFMSSVGWSLHLLTYIY
jgi:hypothetical protein